MLHNYFFPIHVDILYIFMIRAIFHAWFSQLPSLNYG